MSAAFRHIEIVRWRSDADPEAVRAAEEFAARALAATAFQALVVGPNLRLFDGATGDWGYSADIERREDLAEWSRSEACRTLRELLAPIKESVIYIQIDMTGEP